MKRSKPIFMCALAVITTLMLLSPIFHGSSAWAGMGRAITIPPAGFVPNGSSSDDFEIEADEPSVYLRFMNSRGCIFAPVVFPKKAARIKKVLVFLRDDSPSTDGFFKMNRVDMAAGTAVLLGDFNTEDSVDVKTYEIPVSRRKISQEFSYQITGCIDPGIRVYGARTRYEE